MLLIKNFNEVVRLYMDPKNEPFVANSKILYSLEGKIVLEKEEEMFSASFVEKFLRLLERAPEDTLLLALVDVEKFEEENAKRCARILSSKLCSKKVYCIEYLKTIDWENSCAGQIGKNPFKFTIFHISFPYNNDTARSHFLRIDKRNSAANTKELINMISGDSLIEVKQHLRKVLTLVEATELPGGGRDITCGYCGAEQRSIIYEGGEYMFFKTFEPRWSNCAGCELKYRH